MTDDDLFALCVWDEASGEPYEGKVAVARVIWNRMAQLYESDGTVAGTVLKKFQFSGFWFAMEAGHYTEIEWDQAGAQAEADRLLIQASGQGQAFVWGNCQRAVADGKPGASPYLPGQHPQWDKLDAEPRALMYLNPAVSQTAWATPDAEVATIFHHTFYRA